MKPTQQDLIRLARLAGFHVGDQFVAGASEDDLERFATLLLERFGAGGGEQVTCDGDFPEGFNASLGIPAQALRIANAIMFDVIGKREWDVPCTAQHLLSFVKRYTHPSPTDLKAEYERGLEDALSAAVDAVAFTGGAVDTEARVRFAIEALKGKQ